MLNYSMRFKISMVGLALSFVACSPLREKLKAPQLVELEYSDPQLAQQSGGADHEVSGNLVLEIQQDFSTGKTHLYSSATFHEPVSKNILFDKVRTGELDKIVYKPKPPPIDQPCGIPGFPDCANSVTPPPVTKPEEPCGIPGFPDCPSKQETFRNLIIPQEE